MLPIIQIDNNLRQKLGIDIRDAVLCWVVKKVCRTFSWKVTRVLILTNTILYLSNMDGDLCRVCKIDDIAEMYKSGTQLVLTMKPGAREPSLYLDILNDTRNTPTGSHPGMLENMLRQLKGGPFRCNDVGPTVLKEHADLVKTAGYMTPEEKMRLWKSGKRSRPITSGDAKYSSNNNNNNNNTSYSPPIDSYRNNHSVVRNSGGGGGGGGYSHSSPTMHQDAVFDPEYYSPSPSKSLPYIPPSTYSIPPQQLSEYSTSFRSQPAPGTEVRPPVSIASYRTHVSAPPVRPPPVQPHYNSYSPLHSRSASPHAYSPPPSVKSVNGQIMVTCMVPPKLF
eukprot:TRINITY_DN2786_c2_g1_i1.p1 TRINITY_DN2786_c2_g1~~TRINITY_DN2786_c2_g1_i1.p1  ORF type:complete len:336 (+),score=34.63 TRINITY_DN2786_c2_g1_i1:59-1066(+)